RRARQDSGSGGAVRRDRRRGRGATSTNAPDRCLDQKDIGLTQKVGGARKNLKVKSLGVHLDHFWQYRVTGRDELVNGEHRHSYALRCWVVMPIYECAGIVAVTHD